MDTKCDMDVNLSSGSSHTTEASAQADKTTPPAYYRQKRDSGYSTEVSPSSPSNKTGHFIFDSDASNLSIGLDNEFQYMDFSNDVFSDDENDDNFDEFDDADREVENLFSASEELREDIAMSNSAKAKLARPTAPIPRHIDDLFENSRASSSGCVIPSTVCGTDHKGVHQETFFRPISRSVGTKNMHGLLDLQRPRFQPYLVCKGCTVTRATDRLESNLQWNKDPLPDIVPVSRDRSVSSPEMPTARQEVARRLRRISDEFGVASATRMNPSHQSSSSSFTLSLGIMK